MALKFEKTRIPFFSDVFVAVAVAVLASQGPYCSWKTSFMFTGADVIQTSCT